MAIEALNPTRPIVHPTTSNISGANRWDHILARCGVNRSGHRVEPGLYAVGDPSPDSPVLVSANYTLSYDALRSQLAEVDAFILVLDTKGVNVWCAAGKGTFGTNELVQRIEASHLSEVVKHRKLILPQLGAPGVAAHEVKQRSGFRVEYGPVRAADVPEYLRIGKATPEMRRVRFPVRDRAVLVPVELVHIFLPLLLVTVVLNLIGAAHVVFYEAAAAVLAGVFLFPLLLPWLPTHDFSSKGLLLGGLVAIPFVIAALLNSQGAAWWRILGLSLSPLLAMPPAVAYLALNFTGSSTFTSRTGVRREMNTYIPIMAWMFGIGIVMTVVFNLI